MDLNSFLQDKKKIAIWGAGRFGITLLYALRAEGKKVVCFVVSEGIRFNYEIEDVVVVDSRGLLNVYKKGIDGIIVACNFNSHNIIIQQLNELGIDEYYVVDRDEIPKQYFRDEHPIKTKDLLNQIQPQSRIFGAERGNPIDRYYIDAFLKYALNNIEGDVNSVIEIGEDRYSSKLFPNSKTKDLFLLEKGMDLTNSQSYIHNKYDVFICTQTLNFIYDVREAVNGIYNSLHRDGYAIVTVQGNIGQISEHDYNSWGDYWRFTEMGICKLFDDVFGEKNVMSIAYGNVMAATAFIQGLCYEDIENKQLLDYSDPLYSILVGVVARKI